MKLISLLGCFALLTSGCSSQEKVSKKSFEYIALINNIEFVNPKFDQPKFSCGFLLEYNQDTFAVTAKHILKVIRPDDMKTLTLDNIVKKWSLYSLDKKEEMVI